MAVTAANVRPLEGALTRPRRAGGNVTMGNAVYTDSGGEVQAAKADAAATSDAIGIVVAVNEPAETTAGNDDAVTVCTFGPVAGFTSLTPGAIYYVSDATAGAIVTPGTTGAGKWLKSIGYAESATVLFVTPGIAPARSSALA